MKKLFIILMLFIFVISIAGCGILKSAAELKEYEIGGDSIPSITSVVGERKVTGVESAVENGVKTRQYRYASDSVYDDLFTYIIKLTEDEGWLVTREIDLKTVPGSGELGKASADDGQILLMAFKYDDAGYEIILTKGEGTITPNA